jgi:hypothetical protein
VQAICQSFFEDLLGYFILTRREIRLARPRKLKNQRTSFFSIGQVALGGIKNGCKIP